MSTITKRELKQAVSHLKRARKLIAKPGVWIHGSIGRFADGRDVNYDGDPMDEVVQVCSLGALDKVARKGAYESSELPAARFLACAIAEQREMDAPDTSVDIKDTITTFNDNQYNVVDVLPAWNAAIKLAENMLKQTTKKKR